MTTSYVLAGHAYQSDGSTAISGLTLTIINKTKGESHSGSEGGLFATLITNSAGEWQADVANFTNEYGNGDSISIEAASSTHGKDIETTTIDTSLAGEISINLVLVDEVIYNFNRALNKIGMRVDHYTPTQTTDDPVGEGLDYGSFSAESLGTKTNMTVSFQILSDDEKLVEEGYEHSGIAMVFFKGKETINKDDIIVVPRTSGDKWRVNNKPILF